MKKNLRVLFHVPAPNTIYAGRTIIHGYKHAFEDLHHEFRFLTPNDDQRAIFSEYQPDLFFTGLGPLTLKYLDLEHLQQARQQGTKTFVSIPFWRTPLSKFRVNEVRGISENPDWIKLIKSGEFGDVFYNVCEPEDERMAGFQKATGYKHYTILLAADSTVIFPEYDQRFTADISYIGTYLPEKQRFFRDNVFPLRNKYNLQIYGQDWTWWDRQLGFAQKIGQYFNVPILKNLQKPKLQLEDERRIYNSSTISINVHEEYQKRYGDLNERTFKIPLAGGFEVVDNVPTLSKYFQDGKEIIIARNRDEWFDKIAHYIAHPEKRTAIIEAGRQKILAKHTYHVRVKQIIDIYKRL